MDNKIEKPFLTVIILIFSLVAAFHFVRLSLGWDVAVDGWSLPTLASGLIIIISVFMAYWAGIILNYEKGKISEGKNDDESEEFLRGENQ